jgi:putative colanic acid biosysnthesis UDP-glucose lipid carrier transferase
MLSVDSNYQTLYVYAEPRTRHVTLTYRVIGKRLFDVCFSLFITVFVLLWLIPIVGLLIRLGSRGPILYVQKRTGYRGNEFRCLKFRTMTHNPSDTFKQAIKNDNRVTPIGRFLRRTNLDEMPQFLNVLMGDMSIVGPRPHAVQHDAIFWNNMPSYRKRYRVKPGITGLAQVRGCRGETSQAMQMRHRVYLDRFYIKQLSPWFDIKICWWTLKLMFKGDSNAW